MVSHRSLCDSKSHQLYRILLCILADLTNAVVWMVSTRPLISKSSSPSNNPLVTVPKAPITIGIIVTFLSHSFFNSLARSRYLSFFFFFFFVFFQFYSVASWESKVHNSASSLFSFFFVCFFFFFCLHVSLLQDQVFWLRLGDPFVSQNPWGIFVSRSPGQILGYRYTISSYVQI